MTAPKILVRSLGLVWIALLAVVAWEHAPEHAAAAVPNPKQAALAEPVPVRFEVPTGGTPRVVYHGLVTGSATQSRPTPGQVPSGIEPAGERAPVTAAAAQPQPVVAEPTKTAAPVGAAALPAAISSGRLNLNTASATQLNTIGGGMIGRAIVGGRPYASPDDLLAKRVLNRATYARIKHAVEAR